MSAGDSASTSSLTIPMVGIPLSSGRQLQQLLTNGTAAVSVKFSAAPTDVASYENIAEFSSFGPTADGRVKPDVVAPGLLVSAGEAGIDIVLEGMQIGASLIVACLGWLLLGQQRGVRFLQGLKGGGHGLDLWCVKKCVCSKGSRWEGAA